MTIKKEDVLTLFKKSSTDTFLNHLWNIITWDERAKGQMKKNNVLFWQYSRAQPLAYLVFIFEFDRDEKLINATTKLTSINKVVFTLLALFIIGYAFWLGYGIYLEGSNYTILCIVVVFDSVCFAFGWNLYKVSKHNQIVQMRDCLNQVSLKRLSTSK